MNIFGEPYNRGCFIKQKVDTSNGKGLRLSGDGDIPASDTDPFIVAGFSTRREETVAIMRCFNDKSVIYAFGDNIEQSVLGIKIMGLMPAQSAGRSVDAMMKFYEANRISKNPNKYVYLYYGGNSALSGYLLSMDSSTVSAAYGMQSYDLRLLLVTGKGGGSSGGSAGGATLGGQSTGGALLGGQSTGGALLGGQSTGGALLGGQSTGGAALGGQRSGGVGFVS